MDGQRLALEIQSSNIVKKNNSRSKMIIEFSGKFEGLTTRENGVTGSIYIWSISG